MGVLKTLTDEYFGETIREEDKIDISGLDVEIVSFKDMNGVEHKHGYRVKEGDPDEMAKTLKTLIERAIEFRGPECSLNDIDVSNMKQMCYEDEESVIYSIFENSPFNGDISGWDVSNVKDMKYMFYKSKSFNQDISGWNVSNVENMDLMFCGAISFNQDISKWDVSNVENMGAMFSGATSFNQPLNDWDVSKVKDMYSMFDGAESFNQDISGWNVSSVKNMKYMFWYATSFNQPLNDWDVSNVENMSWMFDGAISFNQPLDNWEDKLSKVKNMDTMFNNTLLEKNKKLPKWYKE